MLLWLTVRSLQFLRLLFYALTWLFIPIHRGLQVRACPLRGSLWPARSSATCCTLRAARSPRRRSPLQLDRATPWCTGTRLPQTFGPRVRSCSCRCAALAARRAKPVDCLWQLALPAPQRRAGHRRSGVCGCSQLDADGPARRLPRHCRRRQHVLRGRLKRAHDRAGASRTAFHVGAAVE